VTRSFAQAAVALLSLSLIVAAGCGLSDSSSSPHGETRPVGDNTQGARVADVTDGDTIEVRMQRRTRDVRLIGIATPELFSGEECGAAEASESMRRRLPNGTRIILVRDPSQDNRDAFERLLRYVEVGNRDVGETQIARGWAEVFVFEAPFERVKKYRRAERRAERRTRGVWGLCAGDFHKPG
jgi:endonuclease YncB( thermonuclease family)